MINCNYFNLIVCLLVLISTSLLAQIPIDLQDGSAINCVFSIEHAKKLPKKASEVTLIHPIEGVLSAVLKRTKPKKLTIFVLDSFLAGIPCPAEEIEELAKKKCLRELVLINTRITGQHAPALAKLSTLKKLTLRSSHMVCSDYLLVEMFKGMKSLESVSLFNVMVAANWKVLPELLQNNKKLTELTIEGQDEDKDCWKLLGRKRGQAPCGSQTPFPRYSLPALRGSLEFPQSVARNQIK